MCGIVGFYHTSLPLLQQEASLREMLGYIRHRGPDEGGYYLDEQMALGSVRLSIIDLISGKQPMSDPSGRYRIVYNGEVYNYKELSEELSKKGFVFRTTSDTEVVLAAWLHWESDCFVRLNGSYAFAIYDRLDNRLILARDRYGKRPLFYTTHAGGFLFASEMKCFLGYPGFDFQFDPQTLSAIFTLWTPLPTQTPFRGIKQLPPASWMSVKNGKETIYEYEPLNFSVPPFKGSQSAAVALTKEKLEQSVRLRLRSDVAVGTYLSGGLDSAIVTKIMSEQGASQLHSFSVAFEEPDFDESSYQDLLSKVLGTQHTRLTIGNRHIAESFPDAVWHAEVPQFRTAQTPLFLLSKEVQSKGIKVVLTGEGADESFLGYDIFKETLIRTDWENLTTEAEKRKALSQLYPYLKHFREDKHGILVGLYEKFGKEKIEGLFSHEIRIHNSALSLRLLKQPFNGWAGLKNQIGDVESFSAFSPVQKAQWLEFKTLLAGYLLSSQGDRMSLAHSVENRCPFLDSEIVHWAASLPQSLKLGKGKTEKYILKQAFKDLPKPVLKRPKQPYRAPDAKVFFEGIGPDYLALVFSESELKKQDVIQSDFAQRFINKLRKGNGTGISPGEDQAFILLLSLLLLDYFFVRKQNSGNKAHLIQWVSVEKKSVAI